MNNRLKLITTSFVRGILCVGMIAATACGEQGTDIIVTEGAPAFSSELRAKRNSGRNLRRATAANRVRPGLGLGNGHGSWSSDSGDEGGGSGETAEVECPTDKDTGTISCDDVSSVSSLSSQASGEGCTCDYVSWCEEDASGACICYTTVSNCG